jgi:hypothetical protein
VGAGGARVGLSIAHTSRGWLRALTHRVRLVPYLSKGRSVLYMGGLSPRVFQGATRTSLPRLAQVVPAELVAQPR